MKEIIKKYYELDDETKEMLYSMNLFHEIENQIKDCDSENIDNLGNEEKLLEIAMTCSYLTSLDGAEIIKRLIMILNCSDITIEDIINLTTDELVELISNVDDSEIKKQPDLMLITRFTYNDLDCLFLKDKDNGNYLLTYRKDTKTDYLVFESLEEILFLILEIKDEIGKVDET